MSDKTQISRSEMRKLLIKQQLQEQRQELKIQLQPLLKTGQRAIALFTPNAKQQGSSGKAIIITGIAIVVAVLGKRRGGWLGKVARYLIINYPGVLHRLIK